MTSPIDGEPDAEHREHRHTAFGLTLTIDPRISIQGLRHDHSSAPTSQPSRVWINPDELDRRWGALATPPVRMRELRFRERLVRFVDFAEPAGYLLWAQDYGRVLISPDGNELLCDPDLTNEAWTNIVSAQALPLAATIRGFEVLHASGVVLNDRAVLLAGPPGAGKSSMAAALVRIGGRLLSDDAVALAFKDGALVAHAGSVTLQLRPAEDARLSTDQRAALGRPAGSVEGKRRYICASPLEAAPLGCFCLLERSEQQPVVERLDAVSPFELIASTFNLSVRTPDRLQRQLDVVSAIVSSGVVHRLRVQSALDASALARILREHPALADGSKESGRSADHSLRERPAEL